MTKGKFIDKLYFQHNYGARNEIALVKLRSAYGAAGYGIYWEIIEKLFENGGEMNLSAIPLFAYEFHLDENDEKILNSVITDFGLFEINEETGDFTATTVAEQLQYRAEQSEKARKKAAARWGNNKQGDDDEESDEPLINSKDISEKIMLLKQRFPNVQIDLNPEALKHKLSNIDVDKLTEAVNESAELQRITSLIALCDKYDRAIKGYYKDKPESDNLIPAASVLSSIFSNIPK